MRRKLGFKPTLREQRATVNKGLRHYELLSGRPTPAGLMNEIAPKRERAAPVSREGPVVAAISELLAVHPRILWAARFNSGAASYEAASGKYAPVQFHRIVRQPKPTRMPDFFGVMTCGLPFAVEAKAPGWTKPTDDREREQMAFLNMIAIVGGIALFATDAAQVEEALK